MKWLKKLILKKENDLKFDNSTKLFDHSSKTIQTVIDRIKYKEERAKSNREFLNGSNLTLKVVLDKIEDDRVENH